MIADILKTHPAFSTLDQESRDKLAARFNLVELNQDENLFFQGDKSENIYFLIKGKLVSLTIDLSGETKIIGYVNVGETVGEIGVLANEPRSLTVRAYTDAALLKLSGKDFKDIAHQYPSVMFAIINPIISRSVNVLEMITSERKNKTVIILPANQETSLHELTDALQKTAEKFTSFLIISDYQTEFSDQDTKAIKDKIRNLSKNKKHIRKICYILSSHETPLATIAMKRAKTVYIAANADSNPKVSPWLDKKIKEDIHHKSKLILIHKNEAQDMGFTTEWLELIPTDLHHHIRMNNHKDLNRLLRFIRGKAIGVVLGGGGTRGWAHIGALKAIREAKIPIDIIGGTSVGAVVAGLYCLNQSYKDTHDKFYQMVVESKHSISWRNLTWPVISLFNAKYFTHSIMKVFGEKRIEDLWLPYFCITSNLATHAEQIHQSGLLWEVTRASTSIPGIMPPMLLNGKLHLDGGLLNNLPVDIMRDLIGTKGKIIAIDLNAFSTDENQYQFPPVLTFKDVILNKFRMIKKYKFPSFVDMFLRGIFLSSRQKDKNNATLASIYVNLDTTRFKLLQANTKEGEVLVNIGYEETKKQINLFKKKNVDIGV